MHSPYFAKAGGGAMGVSGPPHHRQNQGSDWPDHPPSPADEHVESASVCNDLNPHPMTDNLDDPLALAEAVGHELYARDRNAQSVGIKLDEIRPGFARMHLKIRPEMANSHDICHGGVIFTLADTAFAYACNSYNHSTVASGCSIDFVAPAHVGETLTAVAEERARSGRTGLYDIEVRNSHDQTVAYVRGKSYRIKGEVVQRSVGDAQDA
jgi:acyl-CoA thioesterase